MAKKCKTVTVQGRDGGKRYRRTLCWAPTGKRRCYDVYGIVSNKAASNSYRYDPKAVASGKIPKGWKRASSASPPAGWAAAAARARKPKGRQQPGGGVGGFGLKASGKLRKGCRFRKGGRVVCKKGRG